MLGNRLCGVRGPELLGNPLQPDLCSDILRLCPVQSVSWFWCLVWVCNAIEFIEEAELVKLRRAVRHGWCGLGWVRVPGVYCVGSAVGTGPAPVLFVVQVPTAAPLPIRRQTQISVSCKIC